jgi:hypothetical protein
MWYTTEQGDVFMLEYEVATLECRELRENPEEFDYITAYLVNNENEYNADCEVYTESTEKTHTVESIYATMLRICVAL